ncbi:MAG TPA: LPS export ABC transporter permease LptG [Burkholderiales bacterium]|nr:LPS export ABC transporter permease LptG [Burkholderiales bacterium]
MITVTRYLGREIYKSTAFVAVAFAGLFAFFDLINELGDLGKGSYALPQAFLFVALSVPGHLYELFPIAVLVGTLIALSIMAGNSEYTVLRVSGLSPWRAAGTLARIGIWFVVLTVLLGELAAPFAERAAQRVRLGSLGATVSQELKSGLWVKSDQLFVNIRQVMPDNTLRGVLIYDFDKAMHLLSISEAKTGHFLLDQTWQLGEVSRTRFGPDGATVDKIDAMKWTSVLTPDMLSVLMVRPEKMSAWGLYQYSQHLEQNHQRTDRYDIALWKKVVYPFAVLVMMGLALPFAYVALRSGGVGVKMFAGIMLGILFQLLNALFSHLGVLDNWPPMLSAVLPSVLFLTTALGMMYWVERR